MFFWTIRSYFPGFCPLVSPVGKPLRLHWFLMIFDRFINTNPYTTISSVSGTGVRMLPLWCPDHAVTLSECSHNPPPMLLTAALPALFYAWLRLFLGLWKSFDCAARIIYTHILNAQSFSSILDSRKDKSSLPSYPENRFGGETINYASWAILVTGSSTMDWLGLLLLSI